MELRERESNVLIALILFLFMLGFLNLPPLICSKCYKENVMYMSFYKGDLICKDCLIVRRLKEFEKTIPQ